MNRAVLSYLFFSVACLQPVVEGDAGAGWPSDGGPRCVAYGVSGSERVCAQLFHRMDGTVMTKDCPSAWAVGLSEAVRRIGRPTGIVAGALVFVLAVFLTFVIFFGDNIRSLFGASAGGLAGSTVVTPATRTFKAARR